MSKCVISGLLITCIILKLVSSARVNFEVYSGGMIAKGSDYSDLYVPSSPEESARALSSSNYISKDRWITYSKFINETNSTFNEMKSLYQDMNELNDELLTFTSQGQTSVGNLITCNDCGIDDSDKIGGHIFTCIGCDYADIFPRFFPLYMNTNWKLDEITNIANETDKNIISITAFFYNAYVEDDNWFSADPMNHPFNAIPNRLFLNATNVTGWVSNNTFLSPNNSRWGKSVAEYDDINKLYDNLHEPSEWATVYNEYWWQQSPASYMFIYGFSIECSNYDMYQKLITGPVTTITTMTPTNKTEDEDDGSSSYNIDGWILLLSTSYMIMCMVQS